MKKGIPYLLSFFLLLSFPPVKAEDGHRLWLRYNKIKNNHLYTAYHHALQQLIFSGASPILAAAEEYLPNGLSGMLEQPEHLLAYYESLKFHAVPGIKGNQ